MRIIKSGKPWSKEVECTGSGNNNVGCGATLLIGQGDIYQTAHHCYDGSSDYYTTICCPCCGAETDIKLPSGVKWFGTRPGESIRKGRMQEFIKQSDSVRVISSSVRIPVPEIEWQ